jgi:hypothetical protein
MEEDRGPLGFRLPKYRLLRLRSVTRVKETTVDAIDLRMARVAVSW